MKKLMVIIIIFTLILGFLTGLYLYKIDEVNKNPKVAKEILVEDECTEFAKNELVKVNSQEQKVSLSTTLTIKILYKQCNHIVQTSEKIKDNNLVNLTEDEFKKKYPDWEVQQFTSHEIIIYREVDDFCNQHYKLKENDGYIAIYKVDEKGIETLEKVTEIEVKYLPIEDIKRIENGIFAYSKIELNKIMEDFE